MKKIVILFLTFCLLLFTFCGCVETTTNEYGEQVTVLGPYIEISREEGSNVNGIYTVYILTYHRDTKIVHMFISNGDGVAVNEHYIIGKDGLSHMCKWEDGKIVELP